MTLSTSCVISVNYSFPSATIISPVVVVP